MSLYLLSLTIQDKAAYGNALDLPAKSSQLAANVFTAGTFLRWDFWLFILVVLVVSFLVWKLVLRRWRNSKQ